MIQAADYIGIVVDDIDATTRFFRETLGMEVDDAYSIPGNYTQFVTAGDSIFSVQAETALAGHPPVELALRVADADAAHAAWKAKGVEVLDEPSDMPFGRTFTFRTPDGHVLRAWAPPAAG